MISEKEYEVLKMYERREPVDNNKYKNIISSLQRQKFLNYYYSAGKTLSVKFGLTLLGKKAIQEFELFLKEQEQKEKTLKLSEEANKLSAEANEISKKAIKISKTANIISVIACIISLLSILAAVLIGIYC